jgi:hypothetical protein
MNEIEMGPDTTSTRRRVVTGAVVLALALAVGSVAIVAGRLGAKSGTGLPLLPAPSAAASASTPSGAQMAVAQYYPQPLDYRLQGTLPALATHASAYRLDAGVTDAAVTRLARALGLNAAVTSEPSGWYVADGTRRLDVARDNGGQWSYNANAPNVCVGVSAVKGGNGGIVCMSGGVGTAIAGSHVATPAPQAGGNSTKVVPAPGAPTALRPTLQAPPVYACGSGTTAQNGSLPAQGGVNQPAPAAGAPTQGAPIQAEPQKVPGDVVPQPIIPCCPVPSCSPGSVCANSCPPALRAAGLPSSAQAAQDARDLLAKAGVDLRGADVQVSLEPEADLVTVNPAVGGVPTVGMTFSVSLGTKATIQYASGVLAGPSKLGDYPLVGTAEGFKRLQAGQWLLQGGIRPMMGVLGAPSGAANIAPGAPGAPGVAGAPSRQVTVTGAHLVLVRVFGTDRQTYLEPAYLFETAVPSFAPPVAAVADRLLQIAPAVGPRILTPQPAPAPAPAGPGGATPSPQMVVPPAVGSAGSSTTP